MKNLKLYLFFLLVAFSLNSFSQTQKTYFIPDSLKGKTYEYLYKKHNISADKRDSIKELFYSKMYLHKAKNEKDTIRIANGYTQMNTLSTDNNSLIYCDSIINLTKDLDHHVYPAFAYMLKGRSFFNLSEYKKSLDNYLTARQIAQKHSNKELFFYINDGVADIKLSWGNLNDAKTIYKSQLEYLKQNKEGSERLYHSNYFNTLYNLSNAHIELKELDSALFITKKGIKKSLEINNDYWYYGFVKQSGYILYDKKEYLKALDSITKGAVVDDGHNEHLNTNYYKGSIYSKLNQKEKALLHFKKADSIFNTNLDDVNDEAIKTQHFFVKYYSEKKDTNNQLKYINRLLRADSINDTNKKEFTEAITKEYDRPKLLAEKQSIINSLEKSKTKSNNTIIGLIIGLLIVIALAIRFYYKQNIYKKRFNALINKKEETITVKPKDVLQGVSQDVIDSILSQLENFEANTNFTDTTITLDSLAKQFNTNSSYLSKTINYYKEKNFSTYLSGLRIAHCVSRLKTDKTLRSYTIKAIAQESGFKNSESFSKAFYKKTSIYPSFFIKQIEKQTS